jgi:hypothetical protein
MPAFNAALFAGLEATEAMLRNMLRSASAPICSPPNTLRIDFPANIEVPKRYCDQPSRIALVEEIASRIAGAPVQLRLGVSAAVAQAHAPAPVNVQQLRREAEQDPLVKSITETLGAQIIGRVERIQKAEPAPTVGPATSDSVASSGVTATSPEAASEPMDDEPPPPDDDLD